jgi:hypothetical protein
MPLRNFEQESKLGKITVRPNVNIGSYRFKLIDLANDNN